MAEVIQEKRGTLKRVAPPPLDESRRPPAKPPAEPQPKSEPQQEEERAGPRPGIPQVMGSPTTFKLNGKHYELRPLVMSDWGVLQRKALEEYKDTQMSSNARAFMHIPEPQRSKIMEEEWRRILRLDHMDLPTKFEMVDEHGNATDDEAQMFRRVGIEYWKWWADNTYEGKLHMVWLSLCKAQPEITVDWVQENVMGMALEKLVEAVAEVSRQTVGNAEAPAEGA